MRDKKFPVVNVTEEQLRAVYEHKCDQPDCPVCSGRPVPAPATAPPSRCPSCGGRDKQLRMCMIENCGESHFEVTRFNMTHQKAVCSDSWHTPTAPATPEAPPAKCPSCDSTQIRLRPLHYELSPLMFCMDAWHDRPADSPVGAPRLHLQEVAGSNRAELIVKRGENCGWITCQDRAQFVRNVELAMREELQAYADHHPPVGAPPAGTPPSAMDVNPCTCVCHKVGLLGLMCCPCSADEIDRLVNGRLASPSAPAPAPQDWIKRVVRELWPDNSESFPQYQLPGAVEAMKIFNENRWAEMEAIIAAHAPSAPAADAVLRADFERYKAELAHIGRCPKCGEGLPHLYLENCTPVAEARASAPPETDQEGKWKTE